MKFILSAVAMVTAAFAVPASAGTLLAIDQTTDSLVTIDTVTLATTVVGELGVNVRFNGAGYNPNDGVFYMTSGREDGSLYSVDLSTGAATLIGVTGIDHLFGLEYDDANDTLYGAQFGDYGSPMSGLYAIDMQTGVATVVNPAMTRDIGALAYNSDTNQLVGVSQLIGDIFAIDPATGVQTLLNDGAFINDGGFTYDRDSGLFWYSEFGGNLYTIDPNNNYARTLVGTGFGDLTGLGYMSSAIAPGVPEPAAWAMMIGGFGFAGGALRLRSRKVVFAA